MIKPIVTGFAILLGSSVAASAAANCAKSYDNFWEKLRQNGAAKLSAEQRVAINRMGVRAFDACQAGDGQSAANFFDRLQQDGNAKDFWEKLALEGPAKKK